MDSKWIDKVDRNIMPYVEVEGYDRYLTWNHVTLTENRVEELRNVSEKLYYIFCKVYRIIINNPDKYLEKLNIPEKLRQYVFGTNKMNVPTWLSRFDYIIDQAGNFRVVELNADTPCGIVEAYYANQIYAENVDNNTLKNPNADCYEHLQRYLKEIFTRHISLYYDGNDLVGNERPFVFSCFSEYSEDRGNTLFLMHAMQGSIAENILYDKNIICFEDFTNLKTTPNGKVVLPDGREAKCLYRLHPLELLVEETAEDGSPIGEWILEDDKDSTKLFNPTECIILQSKAIMAVIDELYFQQLHRKLENNIFTVDEMECIKNHTISSFLDKKDLPSFKRIISKPIWGREGNGIQVHDNDGNLLVDNWDDVTVQTESDYMYQVMLEQKKLSEFTGEMAYTDSGVVDGYLTFSCFMLGKKADAVFARLSTREISDIEAYCMPIMMN